MEPTYIVIGIVIVAAVILFVFKGRSSASESSPDATTDDDIRALAQQGKKLQAIKWYRELHGVDLKEAKDAVEEMM